MNCRAILAVLMLLTLPAQVQVPDSEIEGIHVCNQRDTAMLGDDGRLDRSHPSNALYASMYDRFIVDTTTGVVRLKGVAPKAYRILQRTQWPLGQGRL
jgi:hypothetical protein